MITVEPDRIYRLTAKNGLYDYDVYTSRTKITWRTNAADPFDSGIYAAGEVAPTPPTTQAVENVEVLQPGTLLEPSSRPGAPYRVMGVLYQALVPLNDDGTANWTHGGMGNGTSMSKPADGKSYVWYQALRVERASDQKKCFLWTVYKDRDYIELAEAPDAPPPPPPPVDTRLTIVAGKTLVVEAVVRLNDGAIRSFQKVSEDAPGGAGDGGVVPAGSGSGSGSVVAEVLTDTVEPVPATEAWRPDMIIDYHMGRWTALTSKTDPRSLITDLGGYWPLGVGGWILLGFAKGFPAGRAFEIEYKESPSEVRQSIDVWIAQVGLEPRAPVRYLTQMRGATNAYAPLGEYIAAPSDFKPKNPPAGHEWAGPAWSFVGKTGVDGNTVSLAPGKGSLSSIPLVGNASPGTYHYMLIVDSRNPDQESSERNTNDGGPDIGRIRVVKNATGIHFLLLVDGSRSAFGDDEKYHDAIRKCVHRALSLSYVGDKRLTVFFIREDFEETEFGYSETDLKGALVEPIVVRIMAELSAGWTPERKLGQKTPLAATINKVAQRAELMKEPWIPAVMIVSDGIPDPDGNYDQAGAAQDILNKSGSAILDMIRTSSGEVNQALVRLGKLPVGYITKLVGPWLKGNGDDKVGDAIRQAYAQIGPPAGKPLLEIVYGHDPVMLDSINHGDMFHTDCLGSDGELRRIGSLAAKRLIRKYNTAGSNEGFQKCRSGKPENLEGYSSVLDRDVHELVGGSVKAHEEAAVFAVDRTSTVLRWKKIKKAAVSGDWQAVSEEESRIRYELKDNDVWTPILETKTA